MHLVKIRTFSSYLEEMSNVTVKDFSLISLMPPWKQQTQTWLWAGTKPGPGRKQAPEAALRSQLKYFRCSQYQWKAQPQVPSAQTAGQATPRSAWPLWVMLATDFQQFEEFSLRLKKPQGITDRHTADISNHHRDNTSIPKLGKVQVAIRLESCVTLWPFSTAQRSECVSTYRAIS